MKRKLICVLLVITVVALVAGCSKPAGTGTGSATASAKDVGMNIVPLVDDGSGAVLPIDQKAGPCGNMPVGVEAVLNLMTDEQKDAVRKGGYTAAISLHTTNADWSLLQLQGIQVVLDEFNIELLASTDAEMKPDKQVSDIESIIGLKPDLLISFVLDNDSLQPVLRKASDAGILISFIDSVPTGFKSPKDYIGMGAADNYANGKASAQALVDYLGGEGEIAMIHFVTGLFHTNQRSDGAREIFDKYPNIKIVAEQQSDSAETGATITESILIAHPNLAGMWVFWDGPGMGAVGAIEQMGKNVKVTTVDLSEDTAYSIASGGAMLAAAAQHPYDQGVAEAILGVAALAGVENIPPYVVVPGEIVTKDSMAKSWERVFKTPVPADMAALLK